MRFLVISGTFALTFGLVLGAGSFAGDPPGELQPLEKLTPGEKKKGAESELPKLKPLAPPEPKHADDGNKKQGNKKELDLKKLPEDSLPKEKIGAKTQAEDPRKVMARIASNMDTVQGLLKNGDTGNETQKIHQKIIEDLEKLMQQSEQQQKKKKKGSQGEKNQSKNQSQNSKNKSTGANKPQSGPGQGQKKQQGKNSSQAKTKPGLGQNKAKSQAKPSPIPKPGQAKSKKNEMKVAQAKKGKEDGKALDPSLKNGKKELDDKNKSTVGKLFKDVWGHFPKEKRMELDSYANEQFMPRYEQLLRQYYSNIAKHSRGKKGE